MATIPSSTDERSTDQMMKDGKAFGKAVFKHIEDFVIYRNTAPTTERASMRWVLHAIGIGDAAVDMFAAAVSADAIGPDTMLCVFSADPDTSTYQYGIRMEFGTADSFRKKNTNAATTTALPDYKEPAQYTIRNNKDYYGSEFKTDENKMDSGFVWIHFPGNSDEQDRYDVDSYAEALEVGKKHSKGNPWFIYNEYNGRYIYSNFGKDGNDAETIIDLCLKAAYEDMELADETSLNNLTDHLRENKWDGDKAVDTIARHTATFLALNYLMDYGKHLAAVRKSVLMQEWQKAKKNDLLSVFFMDTPVYEESEETRSQRRAYRMAEDDNDGRPWAIYDHTVGRFIDFDGGINGNETARIVNAITLAHFHENTIFDLFTDHDEQDVLKRELPAIYDGTFTAVDVQDVMRATCHKLLFGSLVWFRA